MDKRTADAPHAFKKDEASGMHTIDLANSESFIMLAALGTPNVYYAQKANKYYKDVKCTKLFMDAELQALGLPIPAEIASARKKAIQAANDAGEPVDMAALYNSTSPKELLPPKRIQDRLVSNSPEAIEERIIQRLNRSTTGK